MRNSAKPFVERDHIGMGGRTDWMVSSMHIYFLHVELRLFVHS